VRARERISIAPMAAVEMEGTKGISEEDLKYKRKGMRVRIGLVVPLSAFYLLPHA
jgi:hypothetical protein